MKKLLLNLILLSTIANITATTETAINGEKIAFNSNFFYRFILFKSLKENVAFLIVLHIIFAGCSMIDLLVA